ncbi:hypothetical protein ACI2IX_19445 [Leifsonia aquatica]|uniref:hypothetical protein n=1 Tax=Leifsonia aquatica TaxID=144185 RepID=UPI00384F8D9D
MTVLQGVRVNLDGTAEGVKIISTTSGETLDALYKLIGCALVERVDLPEASPSGWTRKAPTGRSTTRP